MTSPVANPSFPGRTAFRLPQRWGRAWPEELNPVFVKEMRQAVRGQLVLTGFLLVMAVMFAVSTALLLTANLAEPGLGGRVFVTLISTLTALTAVCVPGWSGSRMMAERHGEEGPDLLFYTPMRVEEIIQGKFLSNLTLTAVFFSAGAPFLAVTPLLRGVDAPTVLMVTGLCYFTVVFVAQVGLTVACLPVRRVVKGILALLAALLGAPFAVAWLGVCLSFGMRTRGSGLPLVLFFVFALLFGLFLTNVLIVMAAGYLAPRGRLHLRRGLLALWWTAPVRVNMPAWPR